MRAHVVLSVLFVLSRAGLEAAGLQFYFALDWMWMSDPADLRTRLLETLWFFHAFPPGMDAVTGVILKTGGSHPEILARVLFLVFGIAFVNAIYVLGWAAGLSRRAAFVLALAFVMTPPSIYLEYLYLYAWPVATLLTCAAALFFLAMRRPSFGAWFACFAVCALIGFTRSTFHLVWLAAVVTLAAWLAGQGARRVVLQAAVVPVILLASLYAKNAMLFGEFAASTFGPSSFTLVTVARLPADVRGAWIRDGTLSPFAAISVYAAPREYARYFDSPRREGWPPQLTRLDQPSTGTPNFNHWWLLDVHRARRADVLASLERRPLGYLANVADGAREMFRPTTQWHPHDGRRDSPHFQHRQVLGRYEAVYNRLVHGGPFAPFGLYLLLPVVLGWTLLDARRLLRRGDAAARAMGALLVFGVFQIVYVIAASTMLTALEMPRYRFQVEALIWVVSASAVARLAAAARPVWRPAARGSTLSTSAIRRQSW